MNAMRLTGPAAEPLTLQDAKDWLRVSSSDEDITIAALISTTRDRVERHTGLILIDQTWRLLLDAWPVDRCIRSPLRPLKSLDSVRVRDAAGVPTVLLASAFEVDSSSARIAPRSDMMQPGQQLAGIELDITVGFGTTTATLPATLRQAMRSLLAFHFENRGDGSLPIQMPEDVLRLLAPFRLRRLA